VTVPFGHVATAVSATCNESPERSCRVEPAPPLRRWPAESSRVSGYIHPAIAEQALFLASWQADSMTEANRR
jgi:hypothetical protein